MLASVQCPGLCVVGHMYYDMSEAHFIHQADDPVEDLAILMWFSKHYRITYRYPLY